ncbi:Protein CBG05310 [Caenorhabditis briggsae]|uniref:Uncharacterized protein n=2 Tax=Caenorhabditis briggsae TaxID=6238 RepID=A0AAE8ZT26_CAEBR|nr:Protein CBG05310 [Caenorhabditis briggsae]ULT84259.1 hypothetical protein L3Y34_013131 [Caenorhabditis briggsae]CAP25814.1 Protein CBG05310 [Caenorhabditis briggsae]
MSSETTVAQRLFTDKEIKDLNGKVQCLQRLVNHPRCKIPELRLTYTNLLTCMSNLDADSRKPYTEDGRQDVELGFKTMAILEDTLIRVVLGGETVSNVLIRNMSILQQTGDSYSSQ